MNKLSKISIVIAMCISLIQANAAAQTKTGIVAHRGFWNCEEAGYAKNSIAALKCAQNAGFWGSEFDVNMTKDEQLLVYHDGSIDGKKIINCPASEFDYVRLKNGEPIPTIDQFLEQAKKSPEMMLVYELKTIDDEKLETRFAELAIENLEKHGLLDPQRVMFISFSFHICEVIAKKLPGYTVQFLGGSKRPEKVMEAGVNGIDYNHNVFNINKKWVAEAHDLGMTTNAWTVNDEKDMKKMLELGINYLTTDNPLEARELMKEMKVEEIF